MSSLRVLELIINIVLLSCFCVLFVRRFSEIKSCLDKFQRNCLENAAVVQVVHALFLNSNFWFLWMSSCCIICFLFFMWTWTQKILEKNSSYGELSCLNLKKVSHWKKFPKSRRDMYLIGDFGAVDTLLTCYQYFFSSDLEMLRPASQKCPTGFDGSTSTLGTSDLIVKTKSAVVIMVRQMHQNILFLFP